MVNYMLLSLEPPLPCPKGTHRTTRRRSSEHYQKYCFLILPKSTTPYTGNF
ncbi:hypothetical protein HanXRQr2_Chr16g0758281 [Helianthus annuus]|uniref:Uncharacterized protein n=1 Tax=Helianthus annuus TaxID=4232 RepID=A0A251S4U1_HELAN|nr:hypothetical protein HanXRQr2_Chr16g0758281 [Helianthus annuus]